jgi:hypothetical protein
MSSDEEYLAELNTKRRKRIKKIREAPKKNVIETGKSLLGAIKDIPRRTKERWGKSAEGWIGMKEKKAELGEYPKKEEPKKKEEPVKETGLPTERPPKEKFPKVEPPKKKPVEKKKAKDWAEIGRRIINMRKKRAQLGGK